MQYGSIGVFDSGFGGLTVLKEITNKLPQYDFIYLGDNARAPYGTRSFETIYQYTLACVLRLFDLGCPLVILACNTASARALRTIQQIDLPKGNPQKRVLGIIRPSAEVIGNYTNTNHIGVLGTSGTIASQSYIIEINKQYPSISVHQQACPMWVPLVENNELNNAGTNYFVQQQMQQLFAKHPQIDTVLLGCTHYPLLLPAIKTYTPNTVQIITQGNIVANSLNDYLVRHPEINNTLTQQGNRIFYTTDMPENFNEKAGLFYGEQIKSQQIHC